MPHARRWGRVAAVLAAVYLLFFWRLGAFPVDDLMEARGLISAREAVVDGHWLIPTLNGEIRIAKPPLPTWLMALPALATGDVEPGPMRAVAGLAALALAAFAFALAGALGFGPWGAAAAGIILGTSFLVVQLGRNATWDIFTHAFMVGALWAFFRAQDAAREGPSVRAERVPGLGLRRTTAWALTAGALLGLSFFSKGPVTLYTTVLPVAVAALAFRREGLRRLGGWDWAALAVGFVLFAFWWYALILLRHPEASQSMIGHESGAWMKRHVAPPWFYLHFPLFVAPWTLLTLPVLVPRFGAPRIGRGRDYAFLLSWVVLTLVLLSVIPEKKERYLLPYLVPMALLLAALWAHWRETFSAGRQTVGDRFWLNAHAGWLVAVAFAGIAVAIWAVRRGYVEAPWAVTVCVPLAALAGLAAWWARRRDVTRLFLATAAFSVAAHAAAWVISPAIPAFQRPYANLHGAALAPEVAALPVYSAGQMDLREIWEVGRPVKPLPAENPLAALPPDRPVALFTRVPPEKLRGRRHASIEPVGRYERCHAGCGAYWYLSRVVPGG